MYAYDWVEYIYLDAMRNVYLRRKKMIRSSRLFSFSYFKCVHAAARHLFVTLYDLSAEFELQMCA